MIGAVSTYLYHATRMIQGMQQKLDLMSSQQRTFSATFRVQDNRTAEFISASSYSKVSDKSLFGCMETPDGKDFTFVMKNEDQYPDDFKIQVKNAYFRENKDQCRDLSDVALDGYTRNKYF